MLSSSVATRPEACQLLWELAPGGPAPSRRRLFPISGVVLVRDSNGLAVPPNDSMGSIAPHSDHGNPSAAPKPGVIDRGECDLPRAFPFRPGEQYTVLLATDLTPKREGKPPGWYWWDADSLALVVAKPATFTVPDPSLDPDLPPSRRSLLEKAAGRVPARRRGRAASR